MRVAIVYDRVNKWGGAERVLLVLHEIWPEAPLYTSVYDKERTGWAKVFPKVIPSFVQFIPFAKQHHELFPWLTPMAFETFNFDTYDVVISVTSAEAKTIITKPHTMHVCYCLTPTRYLWSGVSEYEKTGGKLYQLMLPILRHWDLVASSRPDYYIAISNLVAERIRTYYHRAVESVIYPPVHSVKYNTSNKNYFLLVSRLVRYKRVDIVIEAFNRLGMPLIIIGDGWEKKKLQNVANKNITFIDRYLTDDELALYYQECLAFVFAGVEDFGIAAAEAQAYGKPVIAYAKSGIAEIVIDGKTGILFKEQTCDALIVAIRQFNTLKFSSLVCSKNAQRFHMKIFKTLFKNSINELWKHYITI